MDDEGDYRGTPDHSNNNNIVNIVAGGLTVHDLTANVAPRGKVRFNLIKDISQLTGEWKSRASSRNREYTFDEIAYFDVTVHKVNSDEQEITFTYLESTFSIHFDEEDRESDDFGYQTSSINCDSLLSLPPQPTKSPGSSPTTPTNSCSNPTPERSSPTATSPSRTTRTVDAEVP